MMATQPTISGISPALARARANGRQIAYTVKEISTQGGYSVAITSNETEDGTFSYTVTNTHTPTFTMDAPWR